MQTIIFLNGDIPGLKFAKKFIKKGSFILAADGGANYLMKAGIKPDLIIGDLDSAAAGTLKYFKKKKVNIIKIEEQETTDFEKCLIYCMNQKLNNIIVFGATSLRPDHTLNNFSVLKRYENKLSVKIISGEFEIFFINKSFKFKSKPGETVSILALPIAKKINTKGLQYSLKNENLEFGFREGTLNKSVSDLVSITFQSGSLLLFKKHFIK